MSASQPAPEQVARFNGFLRKPAIPEQLIGAIEGLLPVSAVSACGSTLPPSIVPELAASTETAPVLDETVFAPLSRMLHREQLLELFTLSFRELDKHLARMQQALAAADRATLHHSAHTIKGSFAVVGARELQQLGATLEAGTGTIADQAATLARIPLAADRLRRMLSTRGVHLELLPPSDQESL